MASHSFAPSARQTAWLIFLAIAVACTSYWLWRLQQPEPIRNLEGPPRADYRASDVSLVSLNADGQAAFSVTGPFLSRHPYDGTLDMDAPTFTFHGEQGNTWQAQSGVAFVNRDATRIELADKVHFHSMGAVSPVHIKTPQIVIMPDERRFFGDKQINVSQGSSILNAEGFRGDYQTKHIELLHNLEATYDPPQ